MDFEKYDITLIGDGASQEDTADYLNALPEQIRVLYWKPSYPATGEEYVRHMQFIKNNQKEVPAELEDFYRRELRRILGMSKFDYAVILTDIKRFFPAMVGIPKVKQVFGTENWQEIIK